MVSKWNMRVYSVVALVCFLLPGKTSNSGEVSPQIIYSTYLGGRDKECIAAIAADASGEAYVVGGTGSPDFPVTPGAFISTTRVNNNDLTGYVSKISQNGYYLRYSSFLGGNFRSRVSAVAVDSAGRAFVAGSTCSSNFPTTRSAVLPRAPGSNKVDACDGFVAWLNAQGSAIEYGTYLGGTREDAASSIALAPGGGAVYVGGYTFSSDFPITRKAAQPKLNGLTNGFFSAIDVHSGQLLYSTYLGAGHDAITGIAAAPNGMVYVAGVTSSKDWPHLRLKPFGKLGAIDSFILRLDPTGKQRPVGVRIGGSRDDNLSSIAVDSHGDIYAVGLTNSPDFPTLGANFNNWGSAFVVKISGQRFAGSEAAVIWSRRVGGHGDDALSSVSAGMPGSVFVAGQSGSKDFYGTRGAIYSRLEANYDPILLQLRASDGQTRFATFLGGSRTPLVPGTRFKVSWYNDTARGVYANADGDVYVAGCSFGKRLPVTWGALQPRPIDDNAEGFVLRMKFAGSN